MDVGGTGIAVGAGVEGQGAGGTGVLGERPGSANDAREYLIRAAAVLEGSSIANRPGVTARTQSSGATDLQSAAADGGGAGVGVGAGEYPFASVKLAQAERMTPVRRVNDVSSEFVVARVGSPQIKDVGFVVGVEEIRDDNPVVDRRAIVVLKSGLIGAVTTAGFGYD